VLLAFVLLACLPGSARANGDPASDVLLTSFVYRPFAGLSPTIARDLDRVLAEANKAGYPVKVALIATPGDLGTEPQFFGRPKDYAPFLAGELGTFQGVTTGAHSGTRVGRAPLLVVMPAGFGLDGFPLGTEEKLKDLAPRKGAAPDDLATAAGLAVQELAGSAGHRIGKVFRKPGSGGGGGIVPILLVLAGLGVALVVLVRLRVRQAQTPE
jgi:hypothetical protein